MPYIYKEELAEGESAAEVYTPEQYTALVEERDNLLKERDTLAESINTVSAERDKLSSDLSSAKTKFADAFLATPTPKPAPQDPVESYNKVDSFDALFD